MFLNYRNMIKKAPWLILFKARALKELAELVEIVKIVGGRLQTIFSKIASF